MQKMKKVIKSTKKSLKETKLQQKKEEKIRRKLGNSRKTYIGDIGTKVHHIPKEKRGLNQLKEMAFAKIDHVKTKKQTLIS